MSSQNNKISYKLEQLIVIYKFLKLPPHTKTLLLQKYESYKSIFILRGFSKKGATVSCIIRKLLVIVIAKIFGSF